MYRIYLESLLTLVSLFVLTIFAYFSYEAHISRDYDLLIERDRAKATIMLFFEDYQQLGETQTEILIKRYSHHSHRQLALYPDREYVPAEVREQLDKPHDVFMQTTPLNAIWFQFSAEGRIYRLMDDPRSDIFQGKSRNDKIGYLMLFVCFCFYCVLITWGMNRRVHLLEKVTQQFSQGDFSPRASLHGMNKLGSLNQSFNHMADQISDLITMNKSLTYTIAHELRSPIFRIQWLSEVLSEINLPDNVQEKLASITEETEEMEALVNELLFYAKIERPETRLNFQATTITAWLENYIQPWQRKSSIHFQLRFPHHITADIDQHLLRRAVNNVVENSVRYARSMIVVAIVPQETGFTIEIHDDGPGVDRQHQQMIFTPFCSIKNTGHEGIGLGLAITSQIVRHHHGQIEVSDSVICQGALFSIHLPYVISG